MTIQPDFWLEGVKREPINGGSAMPVRRFLVIHSTAGATALSSINFWRSQEARGASAHIVIDRDGTIYQCRPFNRTCGHAGKSKWMGFDGLNSCSIGIELANALDNETLARKWSTLPLTKVKQKSWEAYPDAQMQSCIQVARAIVRRFNMDVVRDVVGHEEISPGRKTDPGPAFDWVAFKKALVVT